jgi:hypothetical protein
MALLSVSKIFTPWALAWDKPTIRLPIEQMDRRRSELLAESRGVDDGEERVELCKIRLDAHILPLVRGLDPKSWT